MNNYNDILDYLENRKNYFTNMEFFKISSDYELAINTIKELINNNLEKK